MIVCCCRVAADGLFIGLICCYLGSGMSSVEWAFLSGVAVTDRSSVESGSVVALFVFLSCDPTRTSHF